MNSTTTDTDIEAKLPAESGRTMKAIVRDRYGSADVLELREVEVPGWATTRCSCASARPAWTAARGTSWPGCRT